MQNYIKAWILTLLVLGLAACGPGTDTGPSDTPQRTLRIITSTPQNTRTPTITPTPLVPVLAAGELAGIQLDLWYLWTPGEPDTLAEIANQFSASNDYGITLIPRAFIQPDDFDAAVAEAITSSNLPDILLAHPYQYQPWAEAGLLADLTPYLESPTYGTPSFLEEMYPVFAERDQYNGHRWAYPGLFSGRVILYNQSWAQQLGYPNPPADAGAFQLQACAAAEANGGITGGWMIDSTQGGAAAWLLAFAGSLEKSGQYRFDADEIEAALAFLAGLREAGCAWQPVERYPDQEFIDRQGLFYSVSTREIQYVQEAFSESNSIDQWIAIGYPNTAGESVMGVYGRSYVVVSSNTEKQLAAWLAIQALTATDSQIAFAENNAYLPLDRNTAAQIKTEGSLPPQWIQAFDLLDQAVDEPRLASWQVVRSIVQDAVAQVLDVRFESGTLSLLVRQLADMANEYNQ